ncbi:MAG: hypothetical protein WAW97_08170, partial [Gemmiger qucibialis]
LYAGQQEPPRLQPHRHPEGQLQVLIFQAFPFIVQIIIQKPLCKPNCTTAFLLWQYRIILSADTASEVRQMPCRSRRSGA